MYANVAHKCYYIVHYYIRMWNVAVFHMYVQLWEMNTMLNPKKVQTLSPGDTEMLEHVLLHVRIKLNVCILTLPHVYIFTILSNLTV